MRLFFFIFSLIFLWYCGQKTRYKNRNPISYSPAPTADPGGCEPGSMRELECSDGNEGALIEVCTDRREWSVAANTCEAPTCSETTFEKVKPILTASCVSCHPGYDEYQTASAKIDSYISRINLPQADPRHMPKGAVLSPSDGFKLERWRLDGLKEECDSQASLGPLKLDYIERYIVQDLSNALGAERPLLRYLITKPEFVPGIQKQINSVSLEPRLIQLVSIDPYQRVYRLPLRDFDIARFEWDLIEERDQINFVSQTSNGLLIRFLTQTQKPWLHGRNFNFIANQADVYYELMDIPERIQDFLRLDFIDANLGDQVRRLEARYFGFNGSPIAPDNRLIGRYNSKNGYLWITYDVFDIQVAERDLFQNPLLAGISNNVAFQTQASELIFSLPNGLQGYALYNAQGVRQDFAPVDLVFDSESPFDPQIDQALDCFRCHSNGLISAQDQIRDHVLQNAGQFDAQDVQLVQFLYPSNTSPIFQLDNNKIKLALEEIGAYSDIDPINASTDYFRSPYDLPKTAEIFLVSELQMSACISQSGILQASLGQLNTAGTASFDQIISAAQDVFDECGFDRELFYP